MTGGIPAPSYRAHHLSGSIISGPVSCCHTQAYGKIEEYNHLVSDRLSALRRRHLLRYTSVVVATSVHSRIHICGIIIRAINYNFLSSYPHMFPPPTTSSLVNDSSGTFTSDFSIIYKLILHFYLRDIDNFKSCQITRLSTVLYRVWRYVMTLRVSLRLIFYIVLHITF